MYLDIFKQFFIGPQTNFMQLSIILIIAGLLALMPLLPIPEILNRALGVMWGIAFFLVSLTSLWIFVEVELAWFHLCWENKEKRKKYNMPWWAVGWWRVRTWRCPQAGLDNLEWQRNLTWEEDHVAEGSPNLNQPTPQAIQVTRDFRSLHMVDC